MSANGPVSCEHFQAGKYKTVGSLKFLATGF
ncbi:hypothetical protein X474_11940 [Dethiosulfatarculus sandiegensis]|uniref:Uncharacterized protein n=1 Tax=Dethiosulfatarculus sandiegensis TaxID=1429043 RepID=A0A0D2J6U7_9BACT|nr:hypothetical protein X474_11940 [Dethiosulfatarculus sandiegensis]